ncbi:unnamed protein product [Victoria cruziana]
MAGEAAARAGGGGFLRRTRKQLASKLSLGRPWKRWELQWPQRLLHFSIVDDVLFKIVSTFELIALLSLLSFYFLCCGCSL